MGANGHPSVSPDTTAVTTPAASITSSRARDSVVREGVDDDVDAADGLGDELAGDTPRA
jgi:hypothetical protein